MKAYITTKYGPPEVLQIREVAKPTPKADEVLIKIKKTTVSIGDVKMRGLDLPPGQKLAARLFLGFTKPKKDILGMELAGEIEEAGSDVTKFKVGDEVFASTFWEGLGGYAQYKCMPEDGMLALKPANMSYEQAVPILGGGLTAAKILKMADIQPGQRVLIYGASGNVGTYAVQIAKYLGAKVTGVCSTRNLELVKSLGADKVIDYKTEDFSKSGETYDVIFDAVDKLSPAQWKESLKETGIHLNVDKHSGGVGRSIDHIEYLVFLRELMEAGKIQSVIDKTYTFEQIPEAHEYVETGRKRGCVVVTVDY
ncbi:MAG: NADPH:quinone oxidoreductase [Candidatus Thorarchaeota archaeon SMTZ-45]|nr:MAG: NADPH:quinone oxidoreductase [Candidatus Thorarchaeota archaeon SMTZ-45]